MQDFISAYACLVTGCIQAFAHLHWKSFCGQRLTAPASVSAA
jgi:hypothetical protein